MCSTGDGSAGDGSAVGLVQVGLAALNAAEVLDLPDAQVRSEVVALLACANQLSAALAERIGSFDARDLAQADGLRTTRTWLTGFGRMSQGAATGHLNRARLLRALPALAAAARAGDVSAEHLGKVGQLADRVGLAALRDVDAVLARSAATLSVADLQRACARVAAHLDPDGAPPDPDQDLQRREVTLSRLGSMLYLRGRLDAEGGAALMTAVDALMRPLAAGDERTAAQRRADALVELARGAIAGGGLPTVGGVRPHLGILITPQTLLGSAGTNHNQNHAAGSGHDGDNASGDGVGDEGEDGGRSQGSAGHGDGFARSDPLARAGIPPLPERPWLNWIGQVQAELAQRLACDAIVWRIVLDPATGLPLDVGREHRIVPPWIRKAVHARDRTCRWPGCDAPAEWTDVHHEVPWYLGGTTDIEHLISLCRWHHGLVHEGQWKLTLDHTTGQVHITRPDGTPYELGPSQPWTTPSRQGPETPSDPSRPGAGPRGDPP
jgi:hypothetical protein